MRAGWAGKAGGLVTCEGSFGGAKGGIQAAMGGGGREVGREHVDVGATYFLMMTVIHKVTKLTSSREIKLLSRVPPQNSQSPPSQ